ncbi:Hypothetical Protein FCC1311_078562 [Hondaea fermentalgiana]|uniref:Uncharacterized protein n=1 Tax=Hondaea fermentalgiana TaxID=2315210 RepID=A0A2R5GTB6_9STRA|nr:Hypothetical Protein FCC1311_078562 [Hondaea fermentalgiana]|eukprot:GBG31631.1 Hypothetical Protein FCC1311_078562 [Hondaea fermentalgiana]
MFNFKSLVKDEDGFRTLKEAKARLLEVLDERDTAKFFTLPLDGVPTKTAFTCIRGQDDRIVTHEHAGDTFDIARPFVSSARQETLPGGHVSLIAQTYRFLPNAILETFSRLEGESTE